MESRIVMDAKLCDSALMQFTDDKGNFGPKVDFQFPPKVLSDSRRADYSTIATMPSQTEPLVQWAGADSRKITLQITYIADGIFDCNRIHAQLRLIRGYFEKVKMDMDKNKLADRLAVKLQLWCIGGVAPMTFRMESCEVKYSETMVTNLPPRKQEKMTGGLFFGPVSGSYSFKYGSTTSYFPLKTDITCSFSSWTSASNDFKNLEKTLSPDWY